LCGIRGGGSDGSKCRYHNYRKIDTNHVSVRQATTYTYTPSPQEKRLPTTKKLCPKIYQILQKPAENLYRKKTPEIVEKCARKK
jgi:hypothetical protein